MGLSINEIYVVKDTSNNTYEAEIFGSLSSGYSKGQINIAINGTTIELTLGVNSPDPNLMYAQVMHNYKAVVNMGHFNSGKYAVRLNKNNNYVKWFQVY